MGPIRPLGGNASGTRFCRGGRGDMAHWRATLDQRSVGGVGSFMTVSVDLPPQVEEAYRVAAQAKRVPVDELVREVLIAQQPTTARPCVFEQGLGLFGSPED